VIATPDIRQVRKMVETARTLNPGIEVLIRVDSGANSEGEAALLEDERAGTVFLADREIAASMTEHVLARLTPAIKI